MGHKLPCLVFLRHVERNCWTILRTETDDVYFHASPSKDLRMMVFFGSAGVCCSNVAQTRHQLPRHEVGSILSEEGAPMFTS